MRTSLQIICFTCATCLSVATSKAQQPSPAPTPPLTPAEEKAAALRLPQLDRSGLRPDDRKPEYVKESERNPFGVVSKMADQMVAAEPMTEQKKIQQVLRAMRVAGVSQSSSGRRVMLDSLSLGVGGELPALFYGQVETLLVESIDNGKVVLVFGKADPAGSKRRIVLPFDMKPEVDELLVGEFFTKAVPLDGDGAPAFPAMTNAAAQAAFDAAEKQQFQSLVERQTELLNAPAEPAANETKKGKR